MPLKTTVLVNLITFINHRLPKFQSSKPETETKEREETNNDIYNIYKTKQINIPTKIRVSLEYTFE